MCATLKKELLISYDNHQKQDTISGIAFLYGVCKLWLTYFNLVNFHSSSQQLDCPHILFIPI